MYHPPFFPHDSVFLAHWYIMTKHLTMRAMYWFPFEFYLLLYKHIIIVYEFKEFREWTIQCHFNKESNILNHCFLHCVSVCFQGGCPGYFQFCWDYRFPNAWCLNLGVGPKWEEMSYFQCANPFLDSTPLLVGAYYQRSRFPSSPLPTCP